MKEEMPKSGLAKHRSGIGQRADKEVGTAVLDRMPDVGNTDSIRSSEVAE
jgi:hypothetical protein